MNRWKDIYGPVPAGFEERVEKTLAQLEAAPVIGADLKPGRKTSRRTARRTGRTLLLAAAFGVLLTVSALAAGWNHFGFFSTLFGTGAVQTEAVEVTPTPAPPDIEVAQDGTVTRGAYERTWKSGYKTITSTMPGYERVPVDEAEAERLIGPYVTELDKTIVLENEGPAGYEDHTNIWGATTVTLLHYLEDEAGTAYLYYCVENPNGAVLKTYEYNDLTYVRYFNGVTVRGPFGGTDPILDMDNSTDTKVYVGVPLGFVMEDGVSMLVGDAYMEVGGYKEQIAITAREKVPAVTAAGERCTVTVSPMGMHLSVPEIQERCALMDYVESIVITMTDGSRYVVEDRDRAGAAMELDNTSYMCGVPDRGVQYCFNRLIDPAEIASVTVTTWDAWKTEDFTNLAFSTETIEF